MSSAPRIFRAIPDGPVTPASSPIAVIVAMHWSTGEVTDIRAEALAWTREAVQVRWTPSGGTERTDWVTAADVRRVTPGARPAAPRGASAGDLPRSPNRHRPRW